MPPGFALRTVAWNRAAARSNGAPMPTTRQKKSRKPTTTSMPQPDAPEPAASRKGDVRAKVAAMKAVADAGRHSIAVLTYKMEGEVGASYWVGRKDLCLNPPGSTRDAHYPDIMHQFARTTVSYGEWRQSVEAVRSALTHARSLGLVMQPLTDLDMLCFALLRHNNELWLWPDRTKTPLDQCSHVPCDIKVPYEIEQARKACDFLEEEIARMERIGEPAGGIGEAAILPMAEQIMRGVEEVKEHFAAQMTEAKQPGDGSGGEVRNKGTLLKPPSREAQQAWMLHTMFPDRNQTQVAEEMGNQLKRSITQGQVSRWYGEMRGYMDNGGEPPAIINGKVAYVDPAYLDMGPRTNHLTPRQHLPVSDDDDQFDD
jgi:hypothetical protein